MGAQRSSTHIFLNTSKPGRTYDGCGIVADATIKLLQPYARTRVSEVLDYFFRYSTAPLFAEPLVHHTMSCATLLLRAAAGLWGVFVLHLKI